MRYAPERKTPRYCKGLRDPDWTDFKPILQTTGTNEQTVCG